MALNIGARVGVLDDPSPEDNMTCIVYSAEPPTILPLDASNNSHRLLRAISDNVTFSSEETRPDGYNKL